MTDDTATEDVDATFEWRGEAGGHGQLLDRRPIRLAEVLSDACRSTERVWYLSTALHGGPTVVTCALLIPNGQPPAGGWPVVAWGAGGEQLSAAAANSRFPELHPAAGAYAEFLSTLLQAGFAVAATDYEGRAAHGSVRPFQAPHSEGRSMIDAVLAARLAHSRISPERFSVGHSGGGHAALEAAETAERGYGGDLDLLGVIPLEPAGDFTWILDHSDWLPLPDATRRDHFIRSIYAGIVAGFKVREPDLALADYLGPRALERLEVVYHAGRSDIVKAYSDLDASEFRPRSAAAEARLRGWLAATAVPRQRVGVPLFFATGESQAHLPMVRLTREKARELGDDVLFKVYQGDHREMLRACAPDVIEWMRTRLANGR
jgi:alpha-beta hydrolase superfamily lysophospholipase